MFVEVGPKRALQGFASDVLGDDKVLSLATNHPKPGGVVSFNSALCGLWAAGLGSGSEPATLETAALRSGATAAPRARRTLRLRHPRPRPRLRRDELRRLFDEFVERGRELIGERGSERRARHRARR